MKKIKKITESVRYRLFCIRWLWLHRDWQDTRQKYKQMNREWRKSNEQTLHRH